VGARISACVVSVAALVGALGASAEAATVPVGSLLTAEFGSSPQSGPGTMANTALPAPANATSPVDGTVISWRFRGSAGLLYTPRVIRPTGVGLAMGLRSAAPQPGAGLDVTAGPFTTSLPINKGDLFAVDVPSGGGMQLQGDVAGSQFTEWDPPLPNGGSPQMRFTFGDDTEAPIAAVVRYCVVPNLKGKKPAAARQALAAADCAAGKTSKSKKRRKKKKVLRQSVPPGTSISDTAPIDFTVSKRKRK
jgi:hypothetical protein